MADAAPPAPVPGPHLTLSLKLRVFFLSSVLLLGSAALVGYLVQGHQERLLGQHEEALSDYRRHAIEQALLRNDAGLRQLGPLLFHPPAAPAPAVLDRVASMASRLQSEYGVEAALVFGPDAKILGTRLLDESASAVPPPALLAGLKAMLASEDTPTALLWCDTSCRQYSMLLDDDPMQGGMVFAQDIAPILARIPLPSVSSAGLLVPHPVGNTDLPNGLRPWAGEIIFLKDGSIAGPILQRTSVRHSLAGLHSESVRVSWNQRNYTLSTLPLEVAPGSARAKVLVLSDITDMHRAMHGSMREILSFLALSWLLLEALLLALLWGPLQRVRLLMEALRHIARRDLTALRAALAQPPRRTSDEIDYLYSATLQLANDLEMLESDVHQRDREISARMIDLGRQRDFVRRLIDAVPVIIATHDADGHIHLVNAHGRTLTGFSTAELAGTDFRQSFQLATAVPKGTAPNRESSVFTARSGETHTIEWQHASIPNPPVGAAATISAGVDVTARVAAEAHLRWLAEHDPLTNLSNRRAFGDSLEAALACADAHGAILFLDLNRFRNVNDFSGYAVGDRMLVHVADVLREVTADQPDFRAARIGGDEFALLLRNISAADAQAMAALILQRLERIALPTLGVQHRVSASIGLALYPEHGSSSADLLASADLAMHQAKTRGNGCGWHMLSTEHNEDRLLAQERVYWVEYLRDAIRDERIELFAQPVYRIIDGSIAHYEILARLPAPDGTHVPAPFFIPIAEQSRQIAALDRLVLRQSLDWLRRAPATIGFAVNLSSQTLHDPTLLPFIEEELRRHALDPARLTFEITESDAIQDFAVVRDFVRRLRALGCHFALDDFGTGFSTFHYLREIPVSSIKIDGAFVRNIADQNDDRVFVASMSNLADCFGLTSVAEFVESEAILEVLRTYNVTYAQGNHMGVPRPISELFGAPFAPPEINV